MSETLRRMSLDESATTTTCCEIRIILALSSASCRCGVMTPISASRPSAPRYRRAARRVLSAASAVGADERAGRLERGEVGADGDLRGAEAHCQRVDHHAPFFAQEFADPPAAFFDQETGFGRIHHQARIASISKEPWKAILSCGSAPDTRASAPDTSP